MLLHPSPVLIDIGGIDHEEEIILSQLIDQKVIDGTTVLVAHHTVEDLTYRHRSDIVGEDVVHITFGIRAAYDDLSHMGDIKQSHLLTYCIMLRSDTRILIEQRHVEATKRHHHGPQRQMLVVETGAFLPFFQFLFYCHRLL